MVIPPPPCLVRMCFLYIQKKNPQQIKDTDGTEEGMRDTWSYFFILLLGVASFFKPILIIFILNSELSSYIRRLGRKTTSFLCKNGTLAIDLGVPDFNFKVHLT